MIVGFESVSEAQFETLKKAISNITVLIAGADGNIDKDEIGWAEKLTKIRSYANPNRLTPFYEEVGKTFTEDLEHLIANVPQETDQRNELLSRQLARCNEILPLLEQNLGYELYESYKSFAKHVAKESGGFLGFFSISSSEAKFVDLPMLEAIEWASQEEE